MNAPKKQTIRVRFAPSPTGSINLGTARTALFNWLFAQSHNGEFILRIEDTDKERSRKEYEENILSSLKWLGLEWNEFYRQSDRIEHYKKYLNILLEKKAAYYCFCSEDDLEAERAEQLSSGNIAKYTGRCLQLSNEEVERRKKTEKSVIRFHMPEKKITFHDAIRGLVTFDTSLIGDIVIAKSLTEPLYNFAVVVDDYEMNITHIIRGEDHISNTPKQIMLNEMLGFSHIPIFAHLPLILGSDKKKLSKRDLAKSLQEYSMEGYLHEAICNFLVLLGWHPREDREVISIEDMIKEFSLDRVQKAGAVFNIEKLDWLNRHYLQLLSPEKFLEKADFYIPSEWKNDSEKLKKALLLVRERTRKFSELKEEIELFFILPLYDASLLIWKEGTPEKTYQTLSSLKNLIENISENDFTKETITNAISSFVEENGKGDTLWPLRVALSGKSHSPNPFECADVLGKKETITRILGAIEKLKI